MFAPKLGNDVMVAVSPGVHAFPHAVHPSVALRRPGTRSPRRASSFFSGACFQFADLCSRLSSDRPVADTWFFSPLGFLCEEFLPVLCKALCSCPGRTYCSHCQLLTAISRTWVDGGWCPWVVFSGWLMFPVLLCFEVILNWIFNVVNDRL